ncbi:SprT family protein [Enterococcus faecalis]|uniref:SprT family protein n=1 Tax=Enterococcus faecalis TaxID=1351 RepID=UPI000665A4D9
MTDQALQTLVEKISIVFFQKPFLHQATFNRRLKTTGGRYHLASHHLDFNPTVFLKYGQEELEKVIKHELCHYHLHLAGKGYQHKDKDFQYQCQSCGEVILRKRRIDTTRYVCGKCHGRLSWQAKKEQI